MGLTAGVVGGLGKIYGSQTQAAGLRGTANELNMEAGQAQAAGIQQSITARRRTAYVASNANAAIAAGGLATTGASAQATVGQIMGQGEYDARTALYEGNQHANELNFDASSRRNEASATTAAGWMGAGASIIKGGEDFYSKYGSAA